MLKKFLADYLHVAYYCSGMPMKVFFLTALSIVLMGNLFGEK